MSMLLGHMFSWFPVQATTYCLSTVSWIVCHSPLPLSYSASPENQQSQGLCAETSEIRNQNKFFTSYFEILEIHHSENSNTHLKKTQNMPFLLYISMLFILEHSFSFCSFKPAACSFSATLILVWKHLHFSPLWARSFCTFQFFLENSRQAFLRVLDVLLSWETVISLLNKFISFKIVESLAFGFSFAFSFDILI